MKNFAKLLFLAIFAVTLFGAPVLCFAQEHEVDLYFFYGESCPHCGKEEIFLDKLEKEISYLNIHRFEVWNDKEAQAVLYELSRISNLNPRGVPITIIGSKVTYGFGTDETTGEEIMHLIEVCHIEQCPDQIAKIFGNDANGLETAVEAPTTETPEEVMPQEDPAETAEAEQEQTTEEVAGLESGTVPEKIHVPILGDIQIKDFSLPVLTLIVAALDGFNPCAMWVLVFLISLLLGIPSARRRWFLGLVFIFASALVYFLFLAAWLNIFLFLGFLIWVRIIVGLVAIGAGLYYLKEFWKNPEGVCKVTSSPTRRWIMDYLKSIAQRRQLLLALGGIILIAFAVNLIELVCSAGLPAIYTQVLALSDLATWQYYLYLIFYIFIFMLDDMFVFVVAMVTLQMTGLSGKYSRYANLIGGIIILILGALLILRPEVLTFGL